MTESRAIRISKAGGLGRADFTAFGTSVTVLSARTGVIATAARAARKGSLTRPDRVAERAAAAAGSGVLVVVGGEIATAGPVPAGGWSVRIAGEPEPIRISEGGMATVRSSEPGSAWCRITVVAESYRKAQQTAAAALAQRDEAAKWLAGLGYRALLVAPDGAVRTAGSWYSTATAA